jgi:DNA polymerase-3 subunit delta'
VSGTADAADAATDAPHPRETLSLVGHRDAEQALLAAYRSGRIPHAFLIGGPQGIGKATLAYRMARFVLAHPDPSVREVQNAEDLFVPSDNPAGRRVTTQAHSDLLVIERGIGDNGKLRKQIVIDDVRRSVAFFGSTAGEGGWRIAIVDAVDELNQSGENALLKVLEEPPPRSLLFLISHSPGNVRATLKSRCRKIMLRPLPVAQVIQAAATALGRAGEEPDIAAAAALADGSVARTLSYLDGDALALHQQVVDLLNQLPALNPQMLHSLGDALAGADPRALDGMIETVNDWLSARLATDTHDSKRMAHMAALWEEINKAAREADIYNLDRKPLIFHTFGLLADAARG